MTTKQLCTVFFMLSTYALHSTAQEIHDGVINQKNY